MTAEQVIRAVSIKQIGGNTYRELAFHLADSRVYRLFCKIGIRKGFGKSALQQGIKALSEKTWEQINNTMIGYAEDQDIEKGRKIRVDCTVVELNIHDPYDSELLVDANRVLWRILTTAEGELSGIIFTFTDHLRRTKRRNLEIMNAKKAEDRKNPADSELTGMMLDSQKDIYGSYPLKAAFDDGFASHMNLSKAKTNGIAP